VLQCFLFPASTRERKCLGFLNGSGHHDRPTIIGRPCLLGLALLGLAGTASRAFGQTPDLAKLREELMAHERENWEYLKTRNRAAMRHFLADDALLIFDGARYDKREFIDDHMTNYRLDSYDIDPNYALRAISPDVVVLLYRVTSRGAVRFDRTETDKVLVSSLYVRRGGKWWSVLYQETPSK
jgi:hypothetical protein